MVEMEKGGFDKAPPVPAVQRKLAPSADKIQSYGLDLSTATPGGHGLVWVAVKDGDRLPKTELYGDTATIRASLVQVTNLGVSVKDSPLNTLILVTRLDNAMPVAGAKVSIRNTANAVVWSGTTDDKGIAVAPNTAELRKPEKTEEAANAQKPSEEEDEAVDSWDALSKLHFIAVAEKDGDVAYTANNWHDGIEPWEFGLSFDLAEAQALLRGTIFADRGVYKLGEEVHLKAVLRSDTATGMQLLPAGTNVTIVIRDGHDKEVDRRTVALNEWSSAEWTWKVPADGVLGTYRVMGRIERQRLRVYGDFLVAAYRRPDFRVDVKTTAPSSIAGTKVSGVISGRYLFGAAMSGRPVKWTYSKSPVYDVPRAITEHFGESEYTFLGEDPEKQRQPVNLLTKEAKLDAKGDLKLSLETDAADGWPWSYQLEGEVTDVSRQKIAGRNSLRIDPAPWYIGIKTPPYFADAAKGIDTAIVAAGLDGNAAAGVTVNVELRRIQWNSVRRAEGNGFYTWDTERKEVPAGTFSVTTTATPAPLHVPIPEGGRVPAGGDRVRRQGAQHHHANLVLRLGRRLHGLAALRPQPHRPRAGAQDVQAGRDRAHPGEVAVGARHRARHHRARRRPHLARVRADVHAADHQRPHRRARHPQRLHLRAAAEGAHEGSLRQRRRRSRQAFLPPRVRGAGRRGRSQAADRRREGQPDRVPPRRAGQNRGAGARREGRRRTQ